MLVALDVLGADPHLGAGIIRNAVWDALHDFPSASPLADVAVVYLDSEDLTREVEGRLEERLKRAMPGPNWSVKHQARMHLRNGEAAYTSLEDAIAKWPGDVEARPPSD